MFHKIAISFQIAYMIHSVSSGFKEPEYSVKILNSENLILSLGDNYDDQNDDLEIIKRDSEEWKDLDNKLNEFHNFIQTVEKTDRPIEDYLEKKKEPFETQLQRTQKFFPDSPYEIPFGRKHLRKIKKTKKREKKNNLIHKIKLKRKISMKKRAVEKREDRKIVEKREVTTVNIVDEVETEYDYLEKDYQELVRQSQEKHMAFKYSEEVKSDENFKEILNKITDLRIPKNCSNVTGIGMQAVECLLLSYKQKEINNREMLNKVSIIFLVWFGIYLVIAVPLWCIKGSVTKFKKKTQLQQTKVFNKLPKNSLQKVVYI